MKYAYPAIFTTEDDWLVVSFPDISGCYTDGKSLIEAMEYAEDALSLMLMTMEDNNIPIPEPTPVKDIAVSGESFVSIITADTLAYRKSISKKSVKKTVSIPEWLDTMITNKNWNLSQVFQEALISKLGIA